MAITKRIYLPCFTLLYTHVNHTLLILREAIECFLSTLLIPGSRGITYGRAYWMRSKSVSVANSVFERSWRKLNAKFLEEKSE